MKGIRRNVWKAISGSESVSVGYWEFRLVGERRVGQSTFLAPSVPAQYLNIGYTCAGGWFTVEDTREKFYQ